MNTINLEEKQDEQSYVMQDRIFGLFKGEWGSGKTVAAASFPNGYCEDVDRKYLKSARKQYSTRHWEFNQPLSWADVYNRLQRFLDGVWPNPEMMNGVLVQPPPNLERFHKNFPFETYWLDSLTRLGDLTLSDMVKFRDQGRSDNKPPTRIIRGGIEFYQLEDYGGENRGLTMVVDAMAMMPCHCILTAHVMKTEYQEIKKGGRVSYESRSIVTGGNKIASKLPTWFNEIWHFEVRPGSDSSSEYVVVTQHVGTDFAKTEMTLPREIVWTNSSLYDIVMDHVKAERNILRPF